MRSTGNNLSLTINNLNISYNDLGQDDASAIIFIHGFPLNKSMWDVQLQILMDTYRVIAYDVRGHGDSDSGNENFSIDLFTNDLLCLMDELKLDKAILCGLSMGGYIALNAAQNYPDRFDALVLSDTQCVADTPEAKEKRLNAIESIRKYGVEKYADDSLISLFAAESIAAKKREIAEVRDMIMNTSKQSLSNTLVALSARKETCSKLADLKIPVLIMVGIEDKITPVSAAKLMHREIPDSFLKTISHAGHLANLENPSVFNYQLRKFLHRFAEKRFQYS